MHRSTVLAITAAASLAGAGLSAAPATAATILSLDSASLCGKAGCFAEKTTFQTSFSGPMSISGLAIDKSMLGSLANYAVKIRFMTKDGTVVGDWGAYTLAVLGGDVVTIGGKPVDWNGAAGDLVLNLEVLVPKKDGGFGGGGGGGGGFASAPVLDEVESVVAGRGGAAGGVVIGGSPQPPGHGYPLPVNLPDVAQGPGRAAVSAAPEPGAWALMLAGFLGAGSALRGRRHLRYS